MSQKRTQFCPACDEDQPFYLGARTRLHLGTKRKWRCAECGYGKVEIDGHVSTA